LNYYPSPKNLSAEVVNARE